MAEVSEPLYKVGTDSIPVDISKVQEGHCTTDFRVSKSESKSNPNQAQIIYSKQP